MKKERKIELLEKGWPEAEIKRAEQILEKEATHDLFFSKIVFWSALIVIIFANLLVSLMLIPFLIALNHWMVYSIVIILAGTIGFLYNFLIKDINYLGKQHHVWAGILVPLLALTNVMMMVWASNRFVEKLNINNPPQNPWLVALIFAIAFILPYVIDKIRRKVKE